MAWPLWPVALCTWSLLGKLQENIKGAQMKIKSNKSWSISIVKRELKNLKFCIGDHPIPMVSTYQTLGQMVQCKPQGERPSAATKAWKKKPNNLENINKTPLQGNSTPGGIQTLPSGNVATQCLQGPNNNCGEDEVNHDFIHCLTNISFYGRGVLELTSLTEENKCSTSKDSRDQTSSNAPPPLPTARHREAYPAGKRRPWPYNK